MTSPIPPAIRRYAEGKISALRAAAELGDQATVSDVLVMTKAAGLPLPRRSPEQEAAELARARRVLGLDRRKA